MAEDSSGRIEADAGARQAGALERADGPPRVALDDDGRRSRLTVFFRLLLALPHLVLLSLWSVLALLLAAVNWFAILISGRQLAGAFQARYISYYTQVLAYLTLAADRFPGFDGSGSYPLEIRIEPASRQSRLKTLFRPVLAVPALLLGLVLGQFFIGTSGPSGSSESSSAGVQLGYGIIWTAAVLGWFAILARGSMPRGLREILAYGIGYLAQLWSYVLLVTDRYPTSDPLYPRYPGRPPEHPVTIEVDDDLRRSRLTVFFRLLLWLPHLVWLILWGLAVVVVVFANWFVTLFAGRPAAPLHRFTARYIRYSTHTYAFLYLVANPFPGFAGEFGTYPVDLKLPEIERQNRWKTAFRLLLAIPALLLAQGFNAAFSLVALFGWFTGIFLGRMPEGLRNLGVLAIRYHAQLAAYGALVTDRYPFAGPSLELNGAASEPAPE